MDHEKCAINCPCNEECPDGCPEPFAGHPCESWFCQGGVPSVCAEETDPIRDPCEAIERDQCLALGCCWTRFYGDPYVPWCHYPKLDISP